MAAGNAARAAGALTLDLTEAALNEGFGLKDASPYNVLFRGASPVFIDVLSFERRDPLDSVWMAYAQFVRTFLLPLMANRYFGLPLNQILTGQRDGIEPETMYRWAGLWRRFVPPFLGLVTIPKWLGGGQSGATPVYRRKPAGSPEQARFVLRGLLRNCRRQLNSLSPPAAKESNWSGYLDHKSLYSSAQLAQKETFVREALDLAGPQTVLDVGANEGRFSTLAARSAASRPGASVVAIDSDPAVMGTLWQAASRENLDVLPLVVDLTRPTPAVGWRNQECASFLDRARGGFDLVMMLAVVHHMLVSERIPLEDLLDLADDLSREYVLIEFVAPSDPMFQRIDCYGICNLILTSPQPGLSSRGSVPLRAGSLHPDRRTKPMALSISPAARHQVTNFLTAFSLGTLCFIRRWYDLENLQPHGLDYFRAAPANSTLLISTILSSLILAGVFWMAWSWVERHPAPGISASWRALRVPADPDVPDRIRAALLEHSPEPTNSTSEATHSGDY